MTIVKGELEKIPAGSRVEIELTTGGPHVQGYWGGLEKEEIKLKSSESKEDSDVTLTTDVVDTVKVTA